MTGCPHLILFLPAWVIPSAPTSLPIGSNLLPPFRLEDSFMLVLERPIYAGYRWVCLIPAKPSGMMLLHLMARWSGVVCGSVLAYLWLVVLPLLPLVSVTRFSHFKQWYQRVGEMYPYWPHIALLTSLPGEELCWGSEGEPGLNLWIKRNSLTKCGTEPPQGYCGLCATVACYKKFLLIIFCFFWPITGSD